MKRAVRNRELEEAMKIRQRNLPPGVTVTPESLDLGSPRDSVVGQEVEIELEVFSEWSATSEEDIRSHAVSK